MNAKTFFIIFVLSHTLFITVSCDNRRNTNLSYQLKHEEIFTISRDTIHVNIDGTLDRALLINNKYYALYALRDPRSTLSIKKFYIIEKNGKLEKEINLPEEILQDTYPKVYYWNSSIMVQTEFDKNTYILNEQKGKLVKNKEYLNIPVFEDETYEITADCRGEFGSTIYFKNKLTGSINSSPSGCPMVINKLGDKYFLNTDGDSYFPDIEINSLATLSPQVFFRNENLFSNFNIATSFIAKGKLYHIYNSFSNPFRFDEKKERVVITQDSAKIVAIEKGEFRPLYTFKDKFNIEFEQQLSPGHQICTFHTEQRRQIGFKKDIPSYRETKYGFIEINGS